MFEPRLRTDVLRDKAGEAGDSTDAEIAERAGVNQSTISRLLAGETKPSVRTLYALSGAYDVPMNELLTSPEPAEASA